MNESNSNSLAEHSATPSLNISKSSALFDTELAIEVAKCLTLGQHVLVIANRYTSAICYSAKADGPWISLCTGEIGPAFFDIAKKRVFSGQLWLATTLVASPAVLDPTTLTKTKLKVIQLKNWQKSDDGRMGHASPPTKARVAALAANHCQFDGCGEDLCTHSATGTSGTYSYYAHIIAASSDGPRGHETLSAQLADDPDNFLLLCDKCHRLIDKVAPEIYTVDVLQQMRRNSISNVKRLLATLRYPWVDRLYILGNVTGQMPHISDYDADVALWLAKLRASSRSAESAFEFGRAHHKPHEDAYWLAVFTTLTYDIPALQGRLNGVRNSGAPRPPLAVFPQHGTSVLLLAGRILGDVAGTHVFQPHRNKVGEHSITRWAWPDDAAVPARDKYHVNILRSPTDEVAEAVLLISLTFTITANRLPATVAVGGMLTLPTVEVRVAHPNSCVILHPDDLALFGAAVDDALQLLQDCWKVKKIHLFVGAPASAVLKVGQKMQARHHATFVCHEPLPSGVASSFAPTIEISTTEVLAIRTGHAVSLQT